MAASPNTAQEVSRNSYGLHSDFCGSQGSPFVSMFDAIPYGLLSTTGAQP